MRTLTAVMWTWRLFWFGWAFFIPYMLIRLNGHISFIRQQNVLILQTLSVAGLQPPPTPKPADPTVPAAMGIDGGLGLLITHFASRRQSFWH